MNLDLAYIEWICWLLGNCAKHWNHHISIFKNIIWKKRLITFFNESSHPPKRTISGWSNIHFLTKENVVMKTAHINQKYYNTKWILSNYWPIVHLCNPFFFFLDGNLPLNLLFCYSQKVILLCIYKKKNCLNLTYPNLLPLLVLNDFDLVCSFAHQQLDQNWCDTDVNHILLGKALKST